MNDPDLFSWQPPPRRRPTKPKSACEWKIVAVRETASGELPQCCSPEDAAAYWRTHIVSAPHFNPDCECFVVLLVNVKQRIRGHHLVSIGSLNETMANPREVFRAAVIGAAHGVVLMHNHPSGDPTPSTADVSITKRLVESGKLLGIQVHDHVIIGERQHCSLREAGVI
jgi:DNA repair protein RadC